MSQPPHPFANPAATPAASPVTAYIAANADRKSVV